MLVHLSTADSRYIKKKKKQPQDIAPNTTTYYHAPPPKKSCIFIPRLQRRCFTCCFASRPNSGLIKISHQSRTRRTWGPPRRCTCREESAAATRRQPTLRLLAAVLLSPLILRASSWIPRRISKNIKSKDLENIMRSNAFLFFLND